MIAYMALGQNIVQHMQYVNLLLNTLNSLDNDMATILDLSKAFDTIDHTILLKKIVIMVFVD